MGIFAGTQWDRPPHCERCGELESVCRCPPSPPAAKILKAPQQQTARLSIEQRKRGKTVTVVNGLRAADNDLAALMTQLKTACGAGGTLKEDVLEIQGSHLEQVRALLAAIGYKIGGTHKK